METILCCQKNSFLQKRLTVKNPNMDTFPDIYDLFRRNVGTPNFIYKSCHVTYDLHLIINVATIFLNIIAFKT